MSIEHPAVLEICKALEKNKEAEVTYINPDANGIINPKDVHDALKDNTVLVSVMYANNEIGTIEPIQEIAKAL
jgi:cysteine desulfurase